MFGHQIERLILIYILGNDNMLPLKIIVINILAAVFIVLRILKYRSIKDEVKPEQKKCRIINSIIIAAIVLLWFDLDACYVFWVPSLLSNQLQIIVFRIHVAAIIFFAVRIYNYRKIKKESGISRKNLYHLFFRCALFFSITFSTYYAIYSVFYKGTLLDSVSTENGTVITIYQIGITGLSGNGSYRVSVNGKLCFEYDYSADIGGAPYGGMNETSEPNEILIYNRGDGTDLYISIDVSDEIYKVMWWETDDNGNILDGRSPFNKTANNVDIEQSAGITA